MRKYAMGEMNGCVVCNRGQATILQLPVTLTLEYMDTLRYMDII